MEEKIASLWEQLTSNNKLDRDRGNQQLELDLKINKDLGDVFVDFITNRSAGNQNNSEITWQTKLGILSSGTILSRHSQNENLTRLAPTAIDWLSDDEVRVRIQSGEFLGALCKSFGPRIYEEFKDVVFQLVRENIDRAFEKSEEIGANSGRMSPRSEEILHDTAGWRNLESSVKCVQALVNGCGDKFHLYVDQSLLDLIFTSLEHPNRFVRETAYQTCATIIEVCSGQAILETENPVMRFAHQFATHFAEGLADNWSQVRMAAAVATRQFLISLQKYQEKSKDVLSLLLPRLCLNRYYLAEGVRIYSQETWVLTVGQNGKSLVEDNIDNFVKYYIECTQADNHAVREAACQCIAELSAKVSPTVVEPHVDVLLETLIECFQDESWPVRDMACVACGSFVSAFPGPSKKKIPLLKELVFENLKDPISSVRQGAAQALAKMIRVYAVEDPAMVQNTLQIMQSAFTSVKDQPVESHRYGDLSSDPAPFGVAKQLRDNDPELHENQTMYSCGSLAPKMKRKGGGGCSDGGKFKKPSEPWEAADGCLYLLCELTNIVTMAQSLSDLLPSIEEAARHRHYTMHYHFLETVAKVLPAIAKGLGKRFFKPHVERFFDPLFYASDNENYLAASTASQDCFRNLADFLGINILRGRVEQYNPNYSRQLEAILQEIPFQGGGGHGFSPMSTTPPLMQTSNQTNTVVVMIPRPSQPSLGGTPEGSPR